MAELVPDEARSEDIVAVMGRCGEELRARSGGRQVVIGVDDAQLLDPVSAALVLHLAASGAAFVLATVRGGEPCPDAVVSLWKDDTARRMDLAYLSDDAVRALVEAALGDPVEEAALDWVAEVSRGNVLYVRELVRGAVEAGALVWSPGFWRLEGRPTASPSLVDLIGQRMDGLTADHRHGVELLALGEPLALEEIEALTSQDTLLEAETRGLIATDGKEEVWLAHPLYGEAVRTRLAPLRARSLRLQLVEVLECRVAFGSDDALRSARLRLDAGAALSTELALHGARAANHAGDPDLGAELATLAGADTDLVAGMLLAQSHTMRNRYEEADTALAAVEALAPGDANARDYLRQRLSLWHWGLRRSGETGALLDRAKTWSQDAGWRTFTSRIRMTYDALGDGFDSPLDPAENGDPAVSDEARRALATMQTMSAFLAGQGDTAAAAAFAARPAIPLRDFGDAGALAALSLIALETGHRWDEVEQYMNGVVHHAVRAHDHAAAGLSARRQHAGRHTSGDRCRATRGELAPGTLGVNLANGVISSRSPRSRRRSAATCRRWQRRRPRTTRSSPSESPIRSPSRRPPTARCRITRPWVCRPSTSRSWAWSPGSWARRLINASVDFGLGYASSQLGPRFKQRRRVAINRRRTFLVKWATCFHVRTCLSSVACPSLPCAASRALAARELAAT